MPYFGRVPKSSKPLTVAEVALLLGKNRKTILRWISAGRLPAQKLAGDTGAYIIRPEDVDALVGGE